MGLDLSLTSTGVVVQEDGTIIHYERIRPPSAKKACFEERAHLVTKRIIRIFVQYEPDLIAIEAPAYSPKIKPVGLWELYGIVKHALWRRQAPFTDAVSPTALKKFFVGSGKATKEEMVAQAQLTIPDANHDVADALALAKYADDNYDDIVS